MVARHTFHININCKFNNKLPHTDNTPSKIMLKMPNVISRPRFMG